MDRAEYKAVSLYRRTLGESFDCMPEVLKRFHDQPFAAAANGTLRVTRGKGVLRRIAAAVMRLPKPGEQVPVHLHVHIGGETEQWTRDFGSLRLVTKQWLDRGLLIGSAGLMRFRFRLTGDESGLRFEFVRCWFIGIPLPFILAPKVNASASKYEESWWVHVCVEAPILGMLTEYEGKMYITGGIGSRWEGETFGSPFELPNDRAYTETCAAIGTVMWNWRMLNITGETKYTDLMETTLYNGVLAGLSLDGMHYFYQNPLSDRGEHRMQKWFGCACCPPNISRLLASLPGCFYSTCDEGIIVHLYPSGKAVLPVPEGGTVTLTQRTNYPWEGEIDITIEENSSNSISLYIRIPSWTRSAGIAVNGVLVDAVAISGSYAQLPMPPAGSTVRLTLPMEVTKLESHPHVLMNWSLAALRRGPLIYCVEAADHPGIDV